MSSRDSITPPSSRKYESNSLDTQSLVTEQLGNQQEEGGSSSHKNPSPTRKKRVRNWSAEDRAAHRIFERSRREAFKGRLTKLAALIPSLQATDPSRLSKHVVIDESISLHCDQQAKLEAVQRQVNSLLDERDGLLTEVNQWRTQAGMPHVEARHLEPLPEPPSNPAAPSRSASIAEHAVIEEEPDMEVQSSQPAAAAPPPPQQQQQQQQAQQQQSEAMGQFDQMPAHLPMETQGLVPQQAAQGWDVMGMNINAQAMAPPPPENNMSYAEMFPSNMVNYQTSVKMEDMTGPGGYVPAGFQQSPVQQSPIQMMNPIFAGDPRAYGQ